MKEVIILMIQIEETGISYLKLNILKTNSLAIYANSNDKEPIWDGNIYVYTKKINDNKRNFTNKELLGKFPIQIKTTNCKKFSKSFRITKSDMQNLEADSGTMYYVIKLKEDSNDYRIYYYRLLNSDTQKFLKKMERNKNNSIKIDFYELPNNPSDIYDLHKHFLEERKHQFLLDKHFDIEEIFNKKELPQLQFNLDLNENYSSFDIQNAIDAQMPYLYRVENDRAIPLARIGEDVFIKSFENFHHKCKFSIFNDEFDLCIMQTNDEILEFSFDNLILLRKNNLLNKKIKGIIFYGFDVITNDVSNLKDKIKQLKLKKALFSNLPICIDGKEYNNFLQSNNCDLSIIQNIDISIQLLEKMKAIFELYNLSLNTDLSKITRNDCVNIDVLYESLILNKTVTNVIEDVSYCKILNYNFLLYGYKTNNGIKLVDFFKNNVINLFYINDALNMSVSKYFALINEYPKKNLMLFYSNYNLNELYDDVIKSFKNSNYYINSLILLGLEMIDTFDVVKDKIYLDIALNLFSYLSEKSDINCFINIFQIKKRLGIVLEEDISKIIEYKNSCNNDYKRCVCSLCLGNEEEYKYYFNKLNEKEKNNILLFPIGKLLKY